MNKFKRFLAAFLAVLMIIGTVPITSLAAPASDIPAEMLDNVYLDALAYTGYKVQAQKDDGTIFKKYAWMDCDKYLSGITYDSSYGTSLEICQLSRMLIYCSLPYDQEACASFIPFRASLSSRKAISKPMRR